MLFPHGHTHILCDTLTSPLTQAVQLKSRHSSGQVPEARVDYFRRHLASQRSSLQSAPFPASGNYRVPGLPANQKQVWKGVDLRPTRPPQALYANSEREFQN